MSWPPNARELLQALANEGLSLAEAAERLGLSKGAVAGKARRLEVTFKAKATPERISAGTQRSWAAAPPAARAERIEKSLGKANAVRARLRNARADD